MKRFTNLLKRFSSCIVVAVSIFASSLLCMGLNIVSVKTAKASQLTFSPKKLTETTSFDTSSTNYPVSITSNWSSVGEENGNITKGIISTDVSNYGNADDKKDYASLNKTTVNPFTKETFNDDNVVMINASSVSKSGYKSPSIELDANAYYRISVDVYTVTANDDSNSTSFASVLISGDSYNSSSDAYYSNIMTNNTWQTINFYVASNSYDSEEVNVEIRLGNKENGSIGVVFFDNFEIYQISNYDFVSMKESRNGIDKTTETKVQIGDSEYYIVNYYSICDVSGDDNYIDISHINPSFEDGLTSWTRITNDKYESDGKIIANVYPIGIGSFDSTSTGAVDPTNGYIKYNTKALLINNVTSNSIGYKSLPISIARHGVYALSVNVKTSDSISGSVTMKIVEENGLNPTEVSYTGITTSGSDTDANGGWETYTFYITGNYFNDTEIHLELWLGGDSTAKGYAWFDNISMNQISYADYDEYSTGTNAKTVDLNANVSGSPSVNNGYFNLVTNENIGDSLTAKNWEVNATSEIGYDVSVVENHKNYVNVLKLENESSSNALSVTSEAVSLSTNSYYVLEFDAYIDELIRNNSSKGNIYVALYEETDLIYTIKLNESFIDMWKNYKVYIKTSNFDLSAKIALRMGSEKSKVIGVAYFDNISLTTTDEAVYTEATNNSSLQTLDLSINNFADDYDKANDTTETNLLKSLQYTSAIQDSNVTYGIMNLKNFDSLKTLFNGITTSPESNNGNFVYVINSDVDTNFNVNSRNYSLTSGTYYKLEISLKTLNIGQDEENKNEDSEIPYGAFIALDGIDDAVIYGIDTSKTNTDVKGYATYTIYVNAVNGGDVNIRFGLGNTNALTKGTLFVDYVSLSTVETEAFDTAKEDKPSNTIFVESKEEETTEEDDTEDTTTDDEDKVDFNFLVIPTLITGLALIIAIVGTLIRKYGKKPSVKVRNDYDRSKVMKAHNLRENIASCEEEIAKLNEELEIAKQELNNIEQPTLEMTDEELVKIQEAIKLAENKVGLIVDQIANKKLQLENLKKQLDKANKY